MNKFFFSFIFCAAALSTAAQDVYTIEAPAEAMEVKTGHLELGGQSPDGGSIEVNSFYLLRNGRPYVPVLGEFHYSRYPREQWKEQLLKMKAGGVNTVPCYIFWNVHEPYEGQFDWSGNRDLRAFVELCGAVGMDVIVRLGPFDHGEMRNGGFPDWLFTKPLEVRSNDVNYLHYAGLLYDQIAAQIKGLYYKDGGPIIGLQVENEHQHSAASWAISYPGEAGDYTTATYDASITMAGVSVQDKEITTADLGDIHMQTLLSMAKERGMDTPLCTATGWGNAAVLGNRGIPVTAGYPYPVWGDVNAKSEFCTFRDLHKTPDYAPVRYNPEDYPSFSVEMGAGIQIIYDKRPVIDPRGAEAMIVRCIGGGANAIGYYMYQGGSSPLGPDGEKFLSDANPKISYDFQAPLGEYGLEKPVYRYLKSLHSFIAQWGSELAPMETVLPSEIPSADDRDHLRYCIRTKDGSGFLFLINFQDHDFERHDMDTAVDVKLSNETIRIPVRLAKDESAILPFNLHLGKALLKYATAQPLMKAGGAWFFFAPDGMPTEYVFKGGKKVKVTPGFNSAFTYKGEKIITLTESQARDAFRIGDRVLLTSATVVENGDAVRLLSLGNPDFEYTWFSDGKFKTYKRSVEAAAPALDCRKAGGRRLAVDFERQKPAQVHEYFLSVDYVADVAMMFQDNRMTGDNLWQGNGPWTIGLNRFSGGGPLTFYFRPLTPDAPFLGTVPQENIPSFENGPVLDIKGVDIIPEYCIDIN